MCMCEHVLKFTRGMQNLSSYIFVSRHPTHTTTPLQASSSINLINMELIDSLCELESLGANHHHEIMALSTHSLTPHHHHDQQQPQVPAAMNFSTDHGPDIQRFSTSRDQYDHHHVLIDQSTATEFGEQGEREKVNLETDLIGCRIFHGF